MLIIAPRLLNRRFAFAIACISCIGAKLVHIYAHIDALSTAQIVHWGVSFFAQDTAVLLFLRLLLDEQTFPMIRWLEVIARVTSTLLVTYILALALLSISFFVMAGSELQWRNVAVASDSSTWSTLLTGLVTSSVVLLALLILAGALQTVCDAAASSALNVLKWPFEQLLATCSRRGVTEIHYTHLPKSEAEGQIDEGYRSDESEESRLHIPPPRRSGYMALLHVVVGAFLMAQIMATLLRPAESSLVFMSWTLPLMPLADFARSGPSLASLLSSSGVVNAALDNATALADPIDLPWLPRLSLGSSLDGFEDWYEDNMEHYSAAKDPLKLSNLDDEPLLALRERLANIDIRHVMIVFLESTRKDVFPLKRDGYVWERLTNSFKNKSLPDAAQERLSRLTPVANYLTGDYNDGFGHEYRQKRGGINANNAFTTSTYTLKSLTGTLCGVSPLAADFNVEKDNHIYQPCLPQIFKALNTLDHRSDRSRRDSHPSREESHRTSEEAKAEDRTTPKAEKKFAGYEWRSSFMQSVTGNYDKQADLMIRMGFKEPGEFIGWRYLKSELAPLGVVDMEDNNYYGMPEEAIEGYVRDMFRTAKQHNERVFLGHLTSTTHHDFGLPEGAPSVHMSGNKENDDLSGYLNAVSYVDNWLGKITNLLEDEGVADETLLIVLGDHGLSIAERGSITPYGNPHVGNYHVPLLLSHPKLPLIDIDDAIQSSQILPTVLDLLIETGSMSEAGAEAATDLLRNYEGQSLIRPLRKFSEENGQGGWQFTVMNPGGSTLVVRDARQPSWRLMVPVFGYYEWRFTDLATDPHETKAILSYDFDTFLEAIQDSHGENAARWTEEAAVVSQWWGVENHRRWRYEE